MSRDGGGYVSAGIKRDEPSQEEFNAASYSFFGDLNNVDDALEGSLEEGLDAPPDEEDVGAEGIEPDEDLSLISMFKNQTQLVAGRDDEDDEGALGRDGRDEGAGLDRMASREMQEDMDSIEGYLKEASTLRDKQDAAHEQEGTPSVSPSKEAASMYGLHLPSSLSPPPFQRQAPEPVSMSPFSLLQQARQQQQAQHAQHAQHAQQPLKVSGPMTAEQLEAQMLGKTQQQQQQPQQQQQQFVPPQLQQQPRPQRSLEQQFAAEQAQHAQQQALLGRVPLPPRPGMQGPLVGVAPSPPPFPPLMPGGGGPLPPSPIPGLPPHGIPGMPGGFPGAAPGMPAGIPGMPGSGSPMHPFLMSGLAAPGGPGGPMHPMARPPFGPHMLQQQQQLMMMQAMSKGLPRPPMVSPPPVPPPGIMGLPPHMQAAALEQHHMHAMMLQRAASMGMRPPPPPQMHQHPRPHFAPHQQRPPQPFQGGPRPPPAFGPNRGIGRPMLGGELMSAQELGHIMQIMYAAVHSGVPYVEDYYYQAYVNKHANGANAAAFEPQALQDLSESVVRLDPSAGARFAAVDGLGKFVLSNIRTPRVLMDLSPEAGGKEAAGPGAPTKPLEQEPLLAARIMIEDCLHLMLDVDDIDRLFTCAAARAAVRRESTGAMGAWGEGGNAALANSLPADAPSLRQRRALLAAGLASSLRLPASPDGASQAAAGPAAKGASSALQSSSGGVGDGVLLRIMSLAKGRALVARALRTLLVPPVPYLAEPAGVRSAKAGRQLPPEATLGHFENGEFKLGGTENGDAAIGGGIEDEEPMELEPPAVDNGVPQGRPEPSHVLWGVLREAPRLFTLPGGLSTTTTAAAGTGALEEERAMIQATHRLAGSLSFVLSSMTRPNQLADALIALAVGLRGHISAPLPLVHSIPGPSPDSDQSTQQTQQQQQQPWLGDVVCALLERGHAQKVSADPSLGDRWSQCLQTIEAAMYAHLQECMRCMERFGGSPTPQLTALACPPMVKAIATQLPHARAHKLRAALRPLLPQGL